MNIHIHEDMNSVCYHNSLWHMHPALPVSMVLPFSWS